MKIIILINVSGNKMQWSYEKLWDKQAKRIQLFESILQVQMAHNNF